MYHDHHAFITYDHIFVLTGSRPDSNEPFQTRTQLQAQEVMLKMLHNHSPLAKKANKGPQF